MTAAKKSEATKTATPTVQPQPTIVAPVAHAAPPQSKQEQTLAKLKEAWTGRGVDLSKLTATPDGKFLIVKVDANWPVVRIGAVGGIELPAIKSYPRAFDAAVEGDVLLKKQTERAAKKSTPAPATPKPAAQPELKNEPMAETPASKKAKAHSQIEQRLESQA